MNTPRFPAGEVASALGASSATFLGSGAFGDTWRVADTAVKIICEDGYPPERVAREVRGLQRVGSDHVVKLLATNTVLLGGKLRPALTFEFVSGGDLEAVVAAGVVPGADDVDALLIGLLRGLRDMHVADGTVHRDVDALLIGLLRGLRDMHVADGTVHRDVKPPNVALRNGKWSQPVLLDLGLARSTTEDTVTVYPGRLGTAKYMAPEQIRGERARKAADLFAVGVTVRAVAGGEHPFYDPTASYTWDEALAAIAGGPRALPDGLSDRAKAVLDRLVSFEEFARGSASSNLKRMEQ